MSHKALLETMNKNELEVLYGALISSSGNGHDFGFVDEIVSETRAKNDKLTKQQIGGYITDLQKKGILFVAGREKINDEYWVQQFVFNESWKNDLYEDDDKIFQLVEELISAKEAE